jgi:hypothetical protein
MNNTNHTMYFSCSSPTETVIGTEVTTPFTQPFDIKTHKTRSRLKKDDKIERAVYSHIRAMRTLGKTKINTSDIADALSLDVRDVNGVIGKLTRKGVHKI